MWLFWIVWACVCAPLSPWWCACVYVHTCVCVSTPAYVRVCVFVLQYQILLSQLSASLSLVVICLSTSQPSTSPSVSLSFSPSSELFLFHFTYLCCSLGLFFSIAFLFFFLLQHLVAYLNILFIPPSELLQPQFFFIFILHYVQSAWLWLFSPFSYFFSKILPWFSSFFWMAVFTWVCENKLEVVEKWWWMNEKGLELFLRSSCSSQAETSYWTRMMVVLEDMVWPLQQKKGDNYLFIWCWLFIFLMISVMCIILLQLRKVQRWEWISFACHKVFSNVSLGSPSSLCVCVCVFKKERERACLCAPKASCWL